jgi:hypothetical protein
MSVVERQRTSGKEQEVMSSDPWRDAKFQGTAGQWAASPSSAGSASRPEEAVESVVVDSSRSAGSSFRDEKYTQYMEHLDELQQIVRSAKDDSVKRSSLTVFLSGERFSALAEDRRAEVESCFVGEGRWDVNTQSFDGTPDWGFVKEKLREVKRSNDRKRSDAFKLKGKF